MIDTTRRSPADASATAHIATPDRRLRVFVSSTLGELAAERRAAREAISRLRLTPVMFELGARPHPPRDLYRAYLAQSDVFIGVYWERYGWVAPGEQVSGLEDEYFLAGDRPKLIYVKTPAPGREERLEALLTRIQRDDRASYRRFADADDLLELVADDLAVLLTERFTTRRGRRPGLGTPRLPAPPTPLLDRDVERTAALTLLRDPSTRLVTLVGPGGIGKTRLAVEVATTLAADGRAAWFADLATITDADDVADAVAAAFGVRPEGDAPLLEMVAERLDGWDALLVLDNVEHVLAAAGDIARLLAGASGLQVLATSRVALDLRGEHTLTVSPLQTPELDEDGASIDRVGRSAAVRLLVARARQVRPDFVLDDGNAAAIAEICRRLDGIPLAIELAAARLRVLSPTALLARLDDVLDLAAGAADRPERQHTLRATLAWSYDLLDPAEQALFARLGAFADGWTLDAAEAVGGDGDVPDVVETMSSLLAHSLVVAGDHVDTEPRFRMLDTIDRYAEERLTERGEVAITRQRLATWLRNVSRQTGAQLAGPDNRLAIARCDVERANLLATLAWAVDADDADTVVRIAAPLFTYWWARGLVGAMFDLAERTAALPSAATLSPDAAALLSWCRGMGHIALGRARDGEPLLRHVAADARALGDDWLLAHATTGLSIALPDEPGAVAGLHGAVVTFRRLGDPWGIAFALIPLGQLALRDGDVAGAIAAHAEALAQADRIDHDQLRAQSHDLLGVDTLAAGDTACARQHLIDAATIHGRLLDHEGIAYCLEGFAALALATGDLSESARLLGAADRARRTVGVAPWPMAAPLIEQLRASVEAGVGSDAFHSQVAAGAEWRPADALRIAAANAASGSG